MKQYDILVEGGLADDRPFYERIKYPDGQISVKVNIQEIEKQQKEGEFYLNERINSYEDLFYVRAIKSVVGKEFFPFLFVPCLFGQRSDRKFEAHQSFDLKLITDVINSCEFERVDILDPHSDVSLALINNSHSVASLYYVRQVVNSIHAEGNLVLVSPDAGAYKKVFKYGEDLGTPVVAANKFRDKDGKITLQFLGDVKDKVCLIVDDLCDGGYTFIKLGEQLKEQGASKVFLYVTHAYFSKGFAELRKVLDGIYCTNSVKDIDMVYFDSYKTQNLEGWLKQFKVV